MSRFGLKIVGAMLLLAVIPLVASYFLVGQVVQVAESVAKGQREHLTAPLAKAAQAYRDLFAAHKQTLRLEAQLIATDPLLLALVSQRADEGAHRRLQGRLHELVEEHPSLGELHVIDADGRKLASADSSRGFDEERYRDLKIQWPLEGFGLLEARFFTSKAPFAEFSALGRAQRTARSVDMLRSDLARFYRRAFLGLFGAALLVAMAVGLFIARRTTKRLSLLVKATRQVAAGDLETRVELPQRDEVSELGDAFNEMVSELAASRHRITYLEKIGAWQEVARRLAHEIKNPLTPIQLAAQQLHSKYEGDDVHYRKLLDDAHDIIREEVGGLRRLVGEFSAFAKLPSVQPEAVDVELLVDDFIKSHSELAERCELRWEPPPKSRELWVDRMLIKHVLLNLLENAVQAAEDAGMDAARVSLSAKDVKGGMVLILQDEGPGMEKATVERAFDPYFSTKDYGTGLGLAIVKKIILEHQGTIDVRSLPGEGTQFTLWLPLAKKGK
ncbi:MAG: HAMP domain-containing protein [Deltaproteobacteria bacterium]|nr:HAMP domain-containing protein [Deltaproteobacteria bacterium]